MNREERAYLFLKELFLLVDQNSKDVIDFVKQFLISSLARKIVRNIDIHYYSVEDTYYSFLQDHQISNKKNNISENVISYFAFIYTKYYFRTFEPFSKILSYLPVEDVMNTFEKYHISSEEEVIFNSKLRYNIIMNPIRNVRSLSNIKLDLTNDVKNLYVAKAIYEKLFFYPEIANLKLNNSFLYYQHNFFTARKINSINELSDFLNDSELKKYMFDNGNNILFAFINKSLFNQHLEEMGEMFISQKDVSYNQMLLFDGRVVYFYNQSRDPRTLYVTINNLDIQKINNSYNRRLMNYEIMFDI